MLPLYACTMLLSASLLFVVQPMVAKMLLPSLGGSSAVWTTSMLFFQLLLLGGYLYAHAGAKWLRPKTQAIVHLFLMVVASVVLPIQTSPELLPSEDSPLLWLLFELFKTVGLPFFVISASAPLLQHWFSRTKHPSATDPYHLYAASNFGSMLALLGYPLIIEPNLGIQTQSLTWAGFYGCLIIGTAACARVMQGNLGAWDASKLIPKPTSEVTLGRRLRWVLWAFIPSSLMLGVTQHLTTDIAAVPLFWVVPLTLYLLTFILVFARRHHRLPGFLSKTLVFWMLAVMAISVLKVPIWLVMVTQLGMFFCVSMHFHGKLADDRPEVHSLTEFFLLMSFGGALGGVLNALMAPMVFDRLVEYWLVLIAACALLPTQTRSTQQDDFAPDPAHYLVPPLVVVMGGILLWAVGFLDWDDGLTMAISGGILLIGAAAVFLQSQHSSYVLAVLLAIAAWHLAGTEGAVAHERSFFGTYKVFDRKFGDFELRKFSHGTTAHGAQGLSEEYRRIPIAYHHPSGPVGQVFQQFPHERVAVVGLGAGAMAAFSGEGRIDFFEIDPLVEEIARDYFTYLDDCADHCRVFVGDGRLLLGKQPDETYDVIFLDAYNSDSVPTHLLTREALSVYLKKLKPEGVIVFHVSNRFLDVRGVVGSLAEDANLIAVTQTHLPPKALRRLYVMRSAYTVVARKPEHLRTLLKDERWKIHPSKLTVWTDNYTNILEVIDWF